MKIPSSEGGFSLAELLVVAVLGSILIMSIYQVVITNQRVYTAQRVQIQGQQSVRAGIDVLFGELREISPSEGDILSMGAQSVTVRAARSFGLICGNISFSPFRFTIRTMGRPFLASDDVAIFADNNEDSITDDYWVEGSLNNVDNSATCPTDPRATDQRLTAGNLNSSVGSGIVHVGAPVRAFDVLTYGLAEIDNEWYLARNTSGGTVHALVGPLRGGDGVEFAYLDSDGNVTTDPEMVAQIQVTLATESDVRDSRGDFVEELLVSTIYLRN